MSDHAREKEQLVDQPPSAIPEAGAQQSRVENSAHASKTTQASQAVSKSCPRCGMDDAVDITDGRCWDCRIAEEEADWMDEDEDKGGAPWGR